jgi:hypothetical protein
MVHKSKVQGLVWFIFEIWGTIQSIYSLHWRKPKLQRKKNKAAQVSRMEDKQIQGQMLN